LHIEPQSQHSEQPQQASAASRGQDGQGGNKAPVAQGRGAKKAPQSKYLAKKNKQREKQQQMQQQKDRRKAETRCGMIMRTRTRVTVTWQDATCEEAIPSVSLIPLHDLLDADFWPQDFVQEVHSPAPNSTLIVEARCNNCVPVRVGDRDPARGSGQ
jgi:hypothetical protein